MEYIAKYQTIVILLAVVVGILIGHNGTVADFSAALIVPLLMMMLFGLFLSKFDCKQGKPYPHDDGPKFADCFGHCRSAFPSQSLIALSLVIGPLIELPVLVLTAQILLKMRPNTPNSI